MYKGWAHKKKMEFMIQGGQKFIFRDFYKILR